MNSRESFTSWVHSTSERRTFSASSSSRGAALAFFVFPVRRDAFFGDQVHLLSANLDFKRLPFEPMTEVCSD